MFKLGLASVAAIAAIALGAGAFAQEARSWIGAAPSHRCLESYDMSIGVSSAGQPRRPVRLDEDRETLNVPAHYGTLVGVTGDGAASVLWFRDSEGVLRNAVVSDAAHRRYRVVQMPTGRFESEAREQ